MRKSELRFEALTEPNLCGSYKSTEQKCLSYKMGKSCKLKNAQNNCSFTEINFCDWAKNLFPQPSFWKCRISLYKPSTDIHFHIIYFLQAKHFHWNWHFLSQKNFNLNVHAFVVVPFATAAALCHKISIIRFDIIMKVGFPTDAIYIRKQSNRSIAIKLFIGLWKKRTFF